MRRSCRFRTLGRLCHAAFALAMAGGCTVGAPPGFSSGDRWIFPLVDPLADGLLVTPAMVNGQGPYLFVIDPDANVSAVDVQVVADAKLRSGKGPHRLDESGTQQIRAYAELLGFKIGNLSIDRRPAMVIPVGLYDSGGRHFSGVIGRDVLADSLVFGFDRDHGIAMVSTTKAFRPPDRSVEVKYQAVSSRMLAIDVAPVPRRLASASINGVSYSLHLDLGARVSQLREQDWSKAQLSPVPASLTLVDEAGMARRITKAAIAKTVALGGATRNDTLFVPYEDQRWDTEGVDGALGLDFFSPFSVWANWDKSTYYITARGEVTATATARLARWGSAIPSCPNPGCVSSEVTTTAEGVMITLTRDNQASGIGLSLVLAPSPVPGKPVPGWIAADLSVATDKVSLPFGPEYAGTTLQVVDVSPFPRACPDNASGCLAPFASSAPAAAPPDGAAVPPPASPPPPNVAPDKLRRLTGDATIAPSDAARQAIAAAGTPPGVAIARVCVAPDGRIESIRLIKSSKITVYDEQLVEAIKTTWTFEPFLIDGRPSTVCSQFAFKVP